MTDYRKSYRSAVRAAALAHVRFGNWTVAPAWSQPIDPSALPAIAVFTPREQRQPSAVRQAQVVTDVVVLVRRKAAGSIEDDLDDDAEAATAMTLAAIGPLCVDVELAQTETDVSGSGEQRIGSLIMTFRALQLIDLPNQP